MTCPTRRARWCRSLPCSAGRTCWSRSTRSSRCRAPGVPDTAAQAAAIVLAHSRSPGRRVGCAARRAAPPRPPGGRGREVRDDDVPPYASRYVARAALQVRDACGDARTVLVGHSGAGYLLPVLRRRPPVGPGTGGVVRLPRRLAAAVAAEVAAGPAAGQGPRAGRRRPAPGRRRDLPEWTDDDLRELVPDHAHRSALVAGLRPRGADFFAEALPLAPDWPDAPCGYLRLSPRLLDAGPAGRSPRLAGGARPRRPARRPLAILSSTRRPSPTTCSPPRPPVTRQAQGTRATTRRMCGESPATSGTR